MTHRSLHRHRLASGLLAGVATGLLATVAPPASAQNTPEPSGGALQLILDSSGSMAAQDPTGGTKIDAARTALGSVVDALPDGATVGVRAYGGTFQDKARGCGDTRLVVPMGELDRAAAKVAFAGLRPLGSPPSPPAWSGPPPTSPARARAASCSSATVRRPAAATPARSRRPSRPAAST